MSIAGAFADLLAGGGVSGLLSAGVGAFAKHRQLKLELQQERQSWAYEMQMTKLQVEADKQMAEHQLLISQEEGANRAFDSAINAEAGLNQLTTSTWVNNIRALFRPFLTLVLWGLVAGLAFSGIDSQAMNVVRSAVVQSAAAATGFWFGSRAIRTDKG